MPFLKFSTVRMGMAALVGAVLLGITFFGTSNAQAADIPRYVGSGSYDFAGAGCNSNDHTDPVGVLFRGKWAGVTNVVKHIERHTIWDSDEDSGPWNWGDHYLRVLNSSGTYECKENSSQKADAEEGPWSRNHVRLWFIPATGGTNEIKTVGTPHHDRFTSCGHAVDEEIYWDYGDGPHWESGFDSARTLLKKKFTEAGHMVKTDDWGNTAPMVQCTGEKAASNGQGVIISVNQLGDADTKMATTSSTNSTLHGTISPDEATPTEWWFGYGTQSAQGDTYQKKTSVRTNSSSSEFDVSEALSSANLLPNATYFVRLFARIPNGEVLEGDEISYRTCGPLQDDDAEGPGPRAVAQCDGDVDVFYRTPSGGLGHNWYSSAPLAQGWHLESLEGSVASGSIPRPVVQSDGDLDVFYRTPSGGVGHNWFSSAPLAYGWHKEDLEGSIASGSDPHPVVQPNGDIDVFYRTPSGGVGHNWFSSAPLAYGWHKEDLEGSIASGSDPHAVVQPDGDIDVFYRTPSGGLGHNWYSSAPLVQGWHKEDLAGSVASDPHAVVQPDGDIDVFYRTPSGGLGHNWYSPAPQAQGWHLENLEGSVASSSTPHPVVQYDGDVDVFYRTPSGGLGHNWYSAAPQALGWHLENLEGSVASSSNPHPVVQPDGDVDVFYRTPSGGLGHNWYSPDPLAQGWHLESLEGSVASDPHPAVQPDGDIDVFYRTPSDGLGHNWWTSALGWHLENLEGSVEGPEGSAPKAITQNAANLSARGATLAATVNPSALSTTYKFEYGKTTAYGSSIPIPNASIGAGLDDVEVSQALSSLAPNTTYHFRVVATNAEGTMTGENKTFKTLQAVPSAITESAVNVTTQGATLRASVNPEGFSTTYKFEYGKTTAYGTSIPVPSEGIGAEIKAISVSKSISGLEAGSTYHFRVVASNSQGTTNGSDLTFTTKGAVTYHSSFGSSGTGNGQFAYPGDVAVDASGNLWVADAYNHRIQKFSSSGTYLSQFGTKGSANGQLNTPIAVAIDSGGNLWVADHGNHRIQKFSSARTYLSKFGSYGSTNGLFNGPEGIAIDSKDNIFVSDTSRVQKFNSKGEWIKIIGSKGSGSGQFSAPTGLDVGPGDYLWTTDYTNNRVQKFNEAGEFLLQVGGAEGSGDGQFKHPTAIDIDSEGNAWVLDFENNRVQKLNDKGEYLTKFGSAGSGAGQFSFGYPAGLTTDSKGSIWVADTKNNRVQRWTQSAMLKATTQEATGLTGTEATLKGTVNPNGKATTYRFEYGKTTSYGTKVPVPDGSAGSGSENVAVSQTIKGLTAGETYHFRVVASNSEGTANGSDMIFTTVGAATYQSSFGSSGTGSGQFAHPAGIAQLPSGNFWIVDQDNDRVQKFSEAGEYKFKFGSSGTGNGQFERPTDIAVDAKENLLIADAGNSRVQRFNSNGEYVSQFGSVGTGNGQFGSGGPEALTIDAKGNIWVADTYNGRVQKFNEKGEFIAVVGSKGFGAGQLGEPTGIDIGLNGNVWVADWQYNRVVEFNEAGEYLRQFGTYGSGNGQFKRPGAIEVDSNGNVWVTDQDNSRVQRFAETGEYLGKFGTEGTGPGQFSFGWPMGIFADTKGNLWISDTDNDRVQKWGS